MTILDWRTVTDYFVSRPGAARETVIVPEEDPEIMDETEAAGDEYFQETEENADSGEADAPEAEIPTERPGG